MTTLQELLALNEATKESKTECKFKKGDAVRLTKAAFKKASKAEDAKMGAPDASAKVKADMFGGTKFTFSKDFHGKKMWDAKDLEAATVSEEIITEAAEYADSSEFTEDFTDISAQLAKIKKTMNTAKWKAWLKVTDENYSTSCVAKGQVAFKAIDAAIKAYDDFDKEMMKAE